MSFVDLDKHFVRLNETWESFYKKIQKVVYKWGSFESWNDKAYGTYFRNEHAAYNYMCNHRKEMKLEMITYSKEGGEAKLRAAKCYGYEWIVKETSSGELWLNSSVNKDFELFKEAEINVSQEIAEYVSGSESRKVYHAYHTRYTQRIIKDGQELTVINHKWWEVL